MATLVLTFAVFIVAVLAMIAGVRLTGRSLKGSCGGPACECATDGGDVLECAEQKTRGSSLPMHPG